MMRKSVVRYTLESCAKCMTCIRACPTSALSMYNGRIRVDQERCINCGKCISSCTHKGLLASGSSLDALKDYDYTVCMVPSALINDCTDLDQAGELFHAIKMLGFDEVVDISDVEGAILEEMYLISDNADETASIASFCPVVNALVRDTYPVLQANITPVKYPSEVAAARIRKQHEGKNVGIFNLCECESKLALAKHPFDNPEYETDHALAIVDIFPAVRRNMSEEREDVCFCPEGLRFSNPAMMLQKDEYLIADGFDKINSVLNMAEFGLLNKFRLLQLFPCFNGCIGGHLLFGNSFLTRNNLHQLTSEKSKPAADLSFEEMYSEDVFTRDEDNRSFMERVEWFKKVNAQLELLPGYDCSACGMQTCRLMAEEIAEGHKTLSDCRVLAAMEDRKTNEDN